jgi:small nuclear ribonucleoprotein (snRNP)-like protein
MNAVNSRKVVTALCLASLGLATLLVSGCNLVKPVPVVPESATIDQQKDYAVLLSNGAVYFGKLEGLGSPWLVMHDVFYIQQGPVDPNTKQPTGMVLVLRGKELHGPDRMILNEKSIVFIEPVGADSRVAQLIKQAGK